MNNVINDILSLDCEERYEYFLTIVAQEREVWILINPDNEFLKIQSDDNNFEFLPVWPSSDFANYYASNASERLTPKSITVPQFFNKWVPGLEGDSLMVGVIPVSGSDVWIMEPSEIKRDIQEVISQF